MTEAFMTRFALIALGVASAAAIVAGLAGLTGLPVSGGAIGGAIGGVVGVMLLNNAGGKDCPRCGIALPATRKPQSLKQALWGGWACPKCGTEIDRKGRAVG
jgi:phosphate/sulfate permease